MFYTGTENKFVIFQHIPSSSPCNNKVFWFPAWKYRNWRNIDDKSITVAQEGSQCQSEIRGRVTTDKWRITDNWGQIVRRSSSLSHQIYKVNNFGDNENFVAVSSLLSNPGQWTASSSNNIKWYDEAISKCSTRLSHLTGQVLIPSILAPGPGYFDSSAVRFPSYMIQPAYPPGPPTPHPSHPQHFSPPQHIPGPPQQFQFPISSGSLRPPSAPLSPGVLDAVIIEAKHQPQHFGTRQPKLFSNNRHDLNNDCRGYSMLGCV